MVIFSRADFPRLVVVIGVAAVLALAALSSAPQRRKIATRCWIKPRSSHRGAIIAVLAQTDADSLAAPAYLEVLPDAVRGLHRSPASHTGGSALRAADAYQINRWQLTKSATDLTLYIDGEPVAVHADSSALPSPMTGLWIGRPNTPEEVRQFNGAIADVAVYSRTLAHEDVRRHYEVRRSLLNERIERTR
jgi:hypothetical protein